jgi:glycosyltransferase involved in cell wall biosynthesis
VTAAAPLPLLVLLPSLAGGGAERVVLGLLRDLDRRRFAPTLALVRDDDNALAAEVPADIPVVALHGRRVRTALPQIVRLIWRMRPAVVLSTLSHLNLALAAIRPLLPAHLRLVARESVVVSEILRTYPAPRLWAWAYTRWYGRFDVVVCQSADMRRDLHERYAIPQDRMVTIHNPVDAERIRCLAGKREREPMLTPHPGSIHLVAAGRLTHQKGFDLLIDALSLCNDPRLHLTVLGEGPQRAALEEQVRDRGLERQVVFAGFDPNPYPHFAAADAFVLSSRFEGLPNVVLEALACGTTVIALPAPGGIAEIASLAGGMVVTEAPTAGSLADALRRLAAGTLQRPPIDLCTFERRRIVARYEAVLETASSAPETRIRTREATR